MAERAAGPRRKRPFVLGLTGSIGSGKTTAGKAFASLGVPVVSADDLARAVVAPGTRGNAEVAEEFGPGVLAPDGSLDRTAMGAIVFNDPARRRALESIIHPRVRAAEIEFIAEHAGAPLAVLDIPLLYEGGADELCDAVLVIAIDDDVRRHRLARTRGMEPAEVERRLAAQIPQHEKINRADHVIWNNGSVDELRAAVEELRQRLP